MGEVKVPAKAYYGAQTQRAVENFPISGIRFPRPFIRALATIKEAAAAANKELAILDAKKADAIIHSATEVADGKFDDQFVVDIFQTGSGTSTNMNANEVIANRAIELLGGKPGDKKLVHPNDDVNMCQSTNDVFPTAIQVAADDVIESRLLPGLKTLANALRMKAREFADVVKSGRTHLQDAVPLTLGQEFSGYETMVRHGIKRIEKSLESLRELPLGGTAVGTGLNAHERYATLAVREVNRLTGLNFRTAENYFEAMQSRDACVEASGTLKTVAVSLMKIANDLRLLSSGPKTGFAEVELPATQPGSSIMPAKVNPVIPEAVNQVAAQVIGNDLTITVAGQAGQLELNTMMPVIAVNLLQSIEILANSSRLLANKCVKGIVADEETCREYAEKSLATVTAIAPMIGYDNATKVAKRAQKEDKTIREILVEEKILAKEKVEKIMDLKKMTKGGIP